MTASCGEVAHDRTPDRDRDRPAISCCSSRPGPRLFAPFFSALYAGLIAVPACYRSTSHPAAALARGDANVLLATRVTASVKAHRQ